MNRFAFRASIAVLISSLSLSAPAYAQWQLQLYVINQFKNKPVVPGCPWDAVLDEYGDEHIIQMCDAGSGTDVGNGGIDPHRIWKGNDCSSAGRPDWQCP